MDEMPISRPRLMAALRALRADDEAGGASAVVPARLLDEVRRLRRARRRSLVKTSVLAAGLCIATAAPIWQLATRDPRTPLSASGQGLPVPQDGEMTTAFFPLIYNTVPMTSGRLVRLEVPPETLTAFGVEIRESSGGPASRKVLADVIVGEDGLARAVRFVRPMTREVQKERSR
jgi:hypothetical protein